MTRPTQNATKLGSVSFLNAKPLIYGLDEADDIALTLDVPAKLIDGLRDRRFDVALLPIIDFQRLAGLRILTSGGIGCDGQTLTVRIFSKVPVKKIRNLACDIHSHSSVALARVILSEGYGLRPDFVDLDHARPGRAADVEACLLIGDKVVCEEPIGFPHQIDLGEEWKKITGLPFVFAAWVAHADVELGDLPDRLVLAKQQGLAHVDEIVQRYAIPRGWPAGLAHQYMTAYLNYDIGPRQLDAIRLFHRLAAKVGMIEQVWDLRVD